MLKITLDVPSSEPANGPVLIIVVLAILAAAVLIVAIRRSRRLR